MAVTSRTARRVLIISPHFPPTRRVGALRAFEFARRLPDFGWAPHVVCLDSPSDGPTDVERRALERLDVLALPVTLDARRGRSASSSRKVPSHGARDRFLDAVDRRIPVDSWLPVFLLHRERVVRFARERRIEIVFCTGDPWSSHVIGRSVARELGVPFVADFRDPWTRCAVRGRERPSWVRAIDARVEAAIVREASALVFTSARAGAAYRAAYRGAGSKIVTIENGFDESVLPDPWLVDRHEGRRAKSTRPSLDLLYSGTFRPLAPALPVIRWLEGLRRLEPELLDGVRVQSMAELDGADRAAAVRAGVLGCFESVPPVPYEEALRRQREADLLLVASDERRDDAIPDELFDALPTGRPVLSLASNPEVAGILRHTGAGEAVDPGEPAWVARLAALVRAKRANHPLPIDFAPDVRALRSYETRRLTAELVRLFERVAAGA